MCAKKGELHGECNRTACSNTNARFYNHSTLKYYCTPCAQLINQHNHNDSMRLYGHALCTLVNVEVNTETENG